MKKILCLSLILGSCVIDSIHKIAVIKNESGKNITVMFETIDSIDDTTLFYGSKSTVNTDSSEELYTMGYFENMNFFIFDYDSVYKNIKQQKIQGIVKKSLLKKISKSMDSLKINDTITYKGN